MIQRKILALTLLFLGLSTFSLFSQKVKYKELSFLTTIGSSTYKKAVKFKEDINKRYFIYKVIDNRKEKNRIGVYKKNDKTYRHFNFPKTLADEVNNYLKLTGYNFNKNNSDTILLEIERFSFIKEKTNHKKKGSVMLTLNFLSKEKTFLYQFNFELKDRDLLFSDISAMDIIHLAMLNALYIFNNISPDYVPERYLNSKITNYAELFTNEPKRGFYASFDELKHNNPSIRPEFTINKERDLNDYHKWEIFLKDPLLEETKKTLFDNIIGFSDGKNIYLNALNYGFRFGFNPVLEKGRYLYFNGRGTGDISNGPEGAGFDYGTAYLMGYLFGLIGELLYAAVASIPKNYDAVVDIKSKKLYIVDEPFLDKIILTAPDIKEFYYNNPNRYDPNMKQLWIKEINKRY